MQIMEFLNKSIEIKVKVEMLKMQINNDTIN